MMELISHLSEWQFNRLSNKDAFSSSMVGLEIRPIAKLNHNRTEGLLTDGKERWRAKKRFLAQRCNRRGESKRERTRECVQFYAPLIER